MVLEKNNIHMNRVKSRANMQFTLDEDINVPDSRRDIGKIICSKPQVQIDSMNFTDKKVNVNGKCGYSILYISDDETSVIENISGEIPFNENLNVDDADSDDTVKCQAYVEDMSVRMINSRKLSVKAVINVVVITENIYDEEIAGGTADDKARCLVKTMNYAGIAFNGNDIFRVKDEAELPKNKPDINRILWKDISLRSRQIRLMDDGFSVKGEINIFILYDTYEGENIEWYETVLPFAGKIDYPGINEEMISDIVLSLTSGNIEVKTDSDGEERLLSIEAVINLDIRVYEEKSMDFLADIYSLDSNIIPVKKNANYEQLLIRNSAKCRTSDKIKIKSADSRMLQICRVEGEVKIDDIAAEDDGILVEGAVLVDVMYIAADDKGPVATIKSAIPFSQKIEVPDAGKDMIYTIRPNIEQLTATVLGNDEIEVRAFINLDALVFKSVNAEFITDITEDKADMSWAMNFPGIVGYIANSEEAIWDIAKKYRTSVDEIKSINNISADTLKKGEKLLITR